MQIGRAFRHLFTPGGAVRRFFSTDDEAAITQAVAESERHHDGEICVVVESALSFPDAARGKQGRDRAVQVFGAERVWDTERNNGVLLYVLLADRDIEIVADRGIAAVVPDAEWGEICGRIETQFRHGNFREGMLKGIREIGELLKRFFPRTGDDKDEIKDTLRVL